MDDDAVNRAVAIVGLGAILPDAPSVAAFWENLLKKRYSITEVPPDRWSEADYYDPDPAAPDKTYSRIGGWVRGFEFDWKQYRVPPKVAAAMDPSQQWAVTIAAHALADYGFPQRPLDTERTGVVLGTAMGGELHYLTALRLAFPEFARALARVPEFRQLAPEVRGGLIEHTRAAMGESLPPVTEDSMPGELPNIVSGRVANVLNLRGPNFISDAACASALAAVEASVAMLVQGRVDAVITGGVDRNMGAASFIKFCKIGALSATGTRPFGDGADGFVMGEGSAAFLLKRLEDAERAGDKIYAVIRGVGGASDGRGKGITAPNPIGQKLAIRRAWQNAGLDPATATMVEAHGTSTRVGDVVEVESLQEVFCAAPRSRIGLGSVKSNIGHLKAGAGAAGLLKATLALHHRLMPPTLNVGQPNPNIDFARTPFYLLNEAEEWRATNGAPRRCGVSAYGFGGTNFHVVLEEHLPGARTEKKIYAAAALSSQDSALSSSPVASPAAPLAPFRGILALGAQTPGELAARLAEVTRRVVRGWTPPTALPEPAELAASERLVIDFGDHAELLERLEKARKALESDSLAMWKPLQAQGISRGRGPKPGKVAFLFPGQGSQYLNMGRTLASLSPVVAEVFAEGDRVMAPILEKPLTSYMVLDSQDPQEVARAEFELQQTAICQPAMLTVDTAVYRLLEAHGFGPDMVMGHSLGEYAALIASDAMPFADALEASAARGREMTRLSMDDNGEMAAVMAPYEAVETTLKEIDGYVVAANINSLSQCVIGGASQAVERAIEKLTEKGFTAFRIPVSHAFHTRIVAPASAPLRQVLDRLHVSVPRLPIVSNVTGEFYPVTTPDAIKDLLQQQVASPVQWIKGLQTLYAAGARTFVEVGPKKALKGFVDDVLGSHPEVVSIFTNHPKTGEVVSWNQALCGLYAAGYGTPDGRRQTADASSQTLDLANLTPSDSALPGVREPAPSLFQREGRGEGLMPTAAAPVRESERDDVGRVIKEGAEMGNNASEKGSVPAEWMAQVLQSRGAPPVYDRNAPPQGSVIISGTGLGLPGAEKPVMDPDNAARILRGEQFVDLIPERFRKKMLDKRITRLVKSEDGSGRFQIISDPGEVVKLAGRPGPFNLAEEFGVPEKLVEALDATTQLAMAAGLDALREASIPLVQTYKRTSTGRDLPDRWLLPESLRDETGVIFASAFPGGDRFADEFTRYYTWQNRQSQLRMLTDLRRYATEPETLREIGRREAELRDALEREPYEFDRRFLFRVLSMGHSQFAEYIGARGPNTQVNAACSSTTQAIGIAEDWIRSGRCRRVMVIAADNVTGDPLMEWVGAGFLATGAAATDDRVEEAALPFDRRRHGTLLGMGACAMVVESEDAVRERGMRGLVELLSSELNNSAFHGTRLDVDHISRVMENLLTAAERRFGLDRRTMAPHMVFMSHETFTPARGGSAAAEVVALREAFGDAANEIIVANTKGFTGHPMGVGIEDVIAIKILESGIVPPVPNFKEVDPDLGTLNLSRGGRYPVQFALHLSAGFGSQIALTLVRRIPGALDRVDNKPLYRRWLADQSGYHQAETEVVKRVLRVKAEGAPPRTPAPSLWQPGTGPQVRAFVGGGQFLAPAPQPVLPFAPAVIPTAPAPAPRPIATPPPVEPGKDQAPTAPTPAVGGDGRGQSQVRPLTTDQAQQTSLGTDASLILPLPPPQKAGQGGEEAAVVAVSASPSAIQDSISGRVLAIVAAKTGYPPEMLDLDLDLEADLGIDTVKQAETFAAIRTEFEIPRIENLKLRDYPTLKSVIEFVHKQKPDLAAAPEVRPPTEDRGEPSAVASPIPWSLEEADRFPRRVPAPVLRPELDLCQRTGVTLGAGSRVVVMMDRGGVGEALTRGLKTCGVTVLEIPEPPETEALEAQVKAWLADGPIQGVYWLPSLEVEPGLEEMDLPTWRELNRQRTKNLYAAMRVLYEEVNAAGAFLMSATRMGGLHGYGETGATAPLGGAVTGFTKAYKRERPNALVKAVDFEIGAEPAETAERLMAETLSDPGVIEVGYYDGSRFSVSLVERPAVDGHPGLVLKRDQVFVITGAAGGITSAIVSDLAAASGGTFYLLDLVPVPEPKNRLVALFRADKEQLKQELIEQARSEGARPTPASIDKKVFGIERQEAALRAVESVQAAGGQAYYRCVNLLDGPAVAAIVDEIRARHGRIDVLVHAAGLEVSRSLPDKDAAQFNLVFDVKADGFFNLLRAARGLPIGATVAFSSVAGRFGNSGQTDYSAANDLLCKVSRSMIQWRPETRGLAIDWTAWGGIGMATRGSTPKIMERAGIEVLPPEVGVPTVRRELTRGGFRGELLVAGKLGILGQEWAENGGLDPVRAQAWLEAHRPPYLMLEKFKSTQLEGGVQVETTLDPQVQPFLYDHQLAGTPVLPGVMGTETLAELASALAPGFKVGAVENIRFDRAFKFFRMQPQTLHLQAEIHPGAKGSLRARTVLRSVSQPKPEMPPQVREHFSADVQLVREAPSQPILAFAPPAAETMPLLAETIYQIFFHGPAYQVLERAGVDGNRSIGLMAQGLPPNTEPAQVVSLMAPRLIELCFQTAGIWEIQVRNTLALPHSVDVIRVYGQPPTAETRRLFAQVMARPDDTFDAQVIDDSGRVWVELVGYRTIALPGSISFS